MSKTTGLSGLSQGIASGARAGTEAFRSRLQQFRTFAPVQAVDFNKLTESQKEEKKAEKFMESAIGLTVNPSNTNMYESHYQLAKDKANLLFSDEVISNYAKDRRSMTQWAQMVDNLNQEIAGYEGFYEDSFGDPSKADGTGSSWADHTVRSKFQGGEAAFWSNMGVEADRTSELNDVMKIVDSRQHTNMTFNFETGEFEYDRLEEQDGAPTGIDPFNVNPQTANELFSFNLSQTTFETPVDFAEKDIFSRVVDSKEQFDIRMEQQLSKDSFRRTVASNYVSQHPNEGYSLDDVMNDPVVFQDAYEDFSSQTYDFAKENKRNAEREARRKQLANKRPSKTEIRELERLTTIIEDFSNPVQQPDGFSVLPREPIKMNIMSGGEGERRERVNVKVVEVFKSADGKLMVKDDEELEYMISADEERQLAESLGGMDNYLRWRAGFMQLDSERESSINVGAVGGLERPSDQFEDVNNLDTRIDQGLELSQEEYDDLSSSERRRYDRERSAQFLLEDAQSEAQQRPSALIQEQTGILRPTQEREIEEILTAVDTENEDDFISSMQSIFGTDKFKFSTNIPYNPDDQVGWRERMGDKIVIEDNYDYRTGTGRRTIVNLDRKTIGDYGSEKQQYNTNKELALAIFEWMNQTAE